MILLLALAVVPLVECFVIPPQKQSRSLLYQREEVKWWKKAEDASDDGTSANWRNQISLSSLQKLDKRGEDAGMLETRRAFISYLIAGSIANSKLSARAEDNNNSSSSSSSSSINNSSGGGGGGGLSASEVAAKFHEIPSFVIVDREGIPFMVFGDDAKLTCYFFTSYEEAQRILKLAIQSSDAASQEFQQQQQQQQKQQTTKLNPDEIKKETETIVNPWKSARISTVPMDFALALTTQTAFGKTGTTYFRFAPAEDDVQDALSLDTNSNKKELAEGKVPLFYMENNTSNDQTLLYFSKSQLLQEIKDKKRSSTETTMIRVTELFAVLNEMIQPKISTTTELKGLVIRPPQNSLQNIQHCQKVGGKQSPFQLGQRIVVY